MLSTPRSDLFNTIMDLAAKLSLKKPLKSWFFGSNTIMLRSASSALLMANFTPLASISSLESLMPAVSDTIT